LERRSSHDTSSSTTSSMDVSVSALTPSITSEEEVEETEKGGRTTIDHFRTGGVPGIIFDIDGVFKRGAVHFPFGAAVLRRVIAANIPFVFLTNGGAGRTENEYANELKHKLLHVEAKNGEGKEPLPRARPLLRQLQQDDSQEEGKEGNMKSTLEITDDQMILAYTPFNTELSHLKKHPVLIVGAEKTLRVARDTYGFREAVHISEYARRNPLLNPFAKRANTTTSSTDLAPLEKHGDIHFRAVLVFSDPSNFFEALQIITDVLLSSKPSECEHEKSHQIPVYFSAGDLLWKSQHRNPRFGLGAFRIALEALYTARMRAIGIEEKEIESRLNLFVQYGKPTTAQFRYAREALQRQAEKYCCEIDRVFVVGDNPASDIHGAVEMNEVSKEPWRGLLVGTGVWRTGDDKCGASQVFANVDDAVNAVLGDC